MIWVYLDRDSHSATDMTAAPSTVRYLTCRVEGLGQNIYRLFLFIPKIRRCLGQA
jgi:hypothetical protein